MKKRVVVALGHRALGTTLPEQKEAVKHTAKAIAGLVEEGYQVAITHSNAPQVGMIHTAMNEFGKVHQDYTPATNVCLLSHEPGVYWVRLTKCHPGRVVEPGDLSHSQHNPYTGDC